MTAGVVLGDARILGPGRWRWLRALAWLAVLTVLAALTFNLAADAVLRVAGWLDGTPLTTRAAAPDGVKLAAICTASVAMLAVYALAVRLGEARWVSELALRPLLPELLVGLAIGAALMAAIVGALVLGGWVRIEASSITGVVVALKETVQSAVIEESLLRLIVFRLLWRAFGVWPALALAAALFGALHLGNPDATVYSALCLIAGEGIPAGLFMLTGRPWLSIGMHAGWNFAQGWLFGGAVSGIDTFAGGPLVTRPVAGVSDSLSGGGFGPESSVAALLISLVASVAILRLAWRGGGFRERDQLPLASGPLSP